MGLVSYNRGTSVPHADWVWVEKETARLGGRNRHIFDLAERSGQVVLNSTSWSKFQRSYF